MPSITPPLPESRRPPVLRCCEPGRTLLFDLDAGSVVAAVDGRVRVVHRDPSREGFDGLSPRASLVLEEGRAWTTACRGVVEIRSLDGRVVVAVTVAVVRMRWWARLAGGVVAALRLPVRLLWRPDATPRR